MQLTTEQMAVYIGLDQIDDAGIRHLLTWPSVLLTGEIRAEDNSGQVLW